MRGYEGNWEHGLAALVLGALAALPSEALAGTTAGPARDPLPGELVALLDAAPGNDDGWLLALTRAGGSAEVLVRALGKCEPYAGGDARWSAGEATALRAALGRFHPKVLQREASVAASYGRGPALAALDVLAQRGGAGAVPSVAGIARRLRLDGRDADASRAFGRAAAHLIERDERALDAWLEAWSILDPGERTALLAGVARQPTARGFELAKRILIRDDGHDELALSVLRLSQGHVSPLERQRTHAAVASRLELGRPKRVLTSAAHTARELRLDGTIEPLIRLVGHSDATTRHGVVQALEALTDQELGTSHVAWNAWLAADAQWWRASRRFDHTLRHGNSAQALVALEAITARRTRVATQARRVLLALQNDSGEVRRRAIEALAQLPCESSVLALARAADGSAGPGLDAHALEALAEIACAPER